MIHLKNISKTFKTKNNSVEALKNLSLTIEDGEIFGIIGLSGAGKSTLIRTINLLERPDSGSVIIDNDDLMTLKPFEVREKRKNIGMIFQLFNLFNSRSISDNIAFPLYHLGYDKEKSAARVKELLEIVGLENKISGYPSQLSGGQKQRVAIARALAANPKILLCDEATSALDPETTQSILALLKELNKKLNLTIVIVTHEMSVIKSICDKVAVMESGQIVESGAVFDVFASPKNQTTKSLIDASSILNKIGALIESGSEIISLKSGEALSYFSYCGANAAESLISNASALFDVKLNIIFADLDIISGYPLGGLILKISGSKENQEKTFAYFNENGVKTEVLKSA